MCIREIKLNRLPSRSYDEPGTKELQGLILKCNLTDIGRDQNQTMKKYTFQRGRSKSRRDLTLVGSDNANKSSNYPFSDHNLNNIKLKIDDIEKGPGSWIMNLNTIKSDYMKQIFTDWYKLWVTEKMKFVNLREW